MNIMLQPDGVLLGVFVAVVSQWIPIEVARGHGQKSMDMDWIEMIKISDKPEFHLFTSQKKTTTVLVTVLYFLYLEMEDLFLFFTNRKTTGPTKPCSNDLLPMQAK